MDVEADAELDPTDKVLREVRDALAAAYSADPLADILSVEDVRTYWEGLSLAAQRVALSALFEPIIYPVGKGWRVTTEGASGRQLNVADTVRPAWRRVLVSGVGDMFTPGLIDAARSVLANVSGTTSPSL